MKISELFKQTGTTAGTPEAKTAQHVADSVTRLSRKRAAALAEFDKARTQHSLAALAVDDAEPGAEQALIAARKSVAKSEEAYLAADGALSAAKIRHAAALAAEARAALVERWDEAEALGRARLECAKRLDEHAKNYGAALNQYLDLTGQFQAAMPSTSRPDIPAAMLNNENVVSAVRLALRRAGVVFAHAGGDLLAAQPEFVDRVKTETDAMLALRSV